MRLALFLSKSATPTLVTLPASRAGAARPVHAGVLGPVAARAATQYCGGEGGLFPPRGGAYRADHREPAIPESGLQEVVARLLLEKDECMQASVWSSAADFDVRRARATTASAACRCKSKSEAQALGRLQTKDVPRGKVHENSGWFI